MRIAKIIHQISAPPTLLFIFLAIFSALAGGLISSGQYFFNFYEKAIASNLQTKLVALQLAGTERLVKFFQEKPITLLFVGDIMLSRGVASQIKKNQDPNYPFLKIATTTRGTDLTFGNLEGPISSRGKNQGSVYSFRADPEVIKGLKFAGFDILSLANNHIWDWGKEALEDTINNLNNNGIASIGAGRNYQEANTPVIFDVNLGTSDVPKINDNIRMSDVQVLKIAFFAYTNLYPKSLEAHSAGSRLRQYFGGQAGQATENSPGISSFELEKAKTDIQQLKTLSLADIIIVSFHWGEEYQTKASESQKRIVHGLIDAGADLIIGHHPHVVQEIEQYGSTRLTTSGSASSSRSGWIAYSLGNFVFDQNFSKETAEGMMLRVVIKNKKIQLIEPIKITINNAFQPEVVGL